MHHYCTTTMYKGLILPFKVMLQKTIHNNDFQHNKALQSWTNVTITGNNVVTMLPRCVTQKTSLPIVPCNITYVEGINKRRQTPGEFAYI